MSEESKILLPRRRLLQMGLVGAGGLVLSGCDQLNDSEGFRSVLRGAEGLNRATQRLITDRTALAREFSAADMSPVFKANGTLRPKSPAYRTHAANGFADWRLRVDGLVSRALSLSLAQIMALP